MPLPRIFNAKSRSDHPADLSQAISGGKAVNLSAQAVRQLNHLQLSASRFLAGHRIGMRPSLRRKPATDFREHRMYTAGDDVRFVDWKASARQEHIFVKQGEHPKEATVYILLDCSASMACGEPAKAECALALASALGYLALSHSDRLFVVPLAASPAQQTVAASTANNRPGALPSLGPINGKGQIPGLLNYLRSLPLKGQVNLTAAIRAFSRQKATSGGLVLVISDLFGVNDLTPALESLPVPTWDIVVFHLLHPEEIQPTRRGDYEMVDIETGLKVNYDITDKALKTYQERLQSWCKDLEMACVVNNAFYTLIPTDWSLEGQIIPHLRQVDVVRPL